MMHENVKKIIDGCNGSSYIANDYLFDNRLSPTQKTLYATLFAICHNPEHPEYCYPAQTTLAELIGLSIRTIQRALKKLIEFKYIVAKRRGSISNLYYIVAKMGQQVVEGAKKVIKGNNNTQKTTKQYPKKNSTWNLQEQRKYNFDKLEDLLVNGNGNYEDCLLE